MTSYVSCTALVASKHKAHSWERADPVPLSKPYQGTLSKLALICPSSPWNPQSGASAAHLRRPLANPYYSAKTE